MDSAVIQISVALWIIVGFVFVLAAVLVIFLFKVLQILKGMFETAKECKENFVSLVKNMNPLINSADDTVKDLKQTSEKIRESAENLKLLTNSVSNFFGYIASVGNILPFLGKGGLFSGIITGYNIIKNIKSKKKKK